MDLLVCRNLLIYLDASAQGHVVPLFHYALREGGFLFLGASETPGDAGKLFDTVDGRHRIFRRRDVAGVARPSLAVSGRTPPTGLPRRPPPMGPPGHDARLTRSIERLLMARFVPCAILVDPAGKVLYIHGRSAPYLEPEQGHIKNDVVAMARGRLRPSLMTALSEARREAQEAVRRGVRLGANVTVDVTVQPLTAPAILQGLLLITIEPSASAAPAADDRAASAVELDGQGTMARELEDTRESLQTTVEDLELSNESLRGAYQEVQSTNEELQSANEELQTSKEELQSVNEELSTVNTQLESKVTALDEARDDMANLLDSMHIATVFLDRDLRVQRFTEQARQIVHLIDTDIGRPLSDLVSRLRYDGLREDCREVLETLEPRDEEVQDDAGRWHLVRLRPYRTADQVVEGVVMSVVDVDRTRRAEIARARATAAKEFFESIVRTIREPLIILDGDLTILLTNEAFQRTFEVHREEAEGRSIYDLGDGPWDTPQIREQLEDVLAREAAVYDVALEGDFPRIGRRAFLLNARHLEQEPDVEHRILLALRDVTEGT